jgi:hypothetical protein
VSLHSCLKSPMSPYTALSRSLHGLLNPHAPKRISVRKGASLRTDNFGVACGPVLAFLGSLLGLVCLSRWPEAALGASLGDLGPLLGPMLAALGRSWSLCKRSWVALGASVAISGSFTHISWKCPRNVLDMSWNVTGQFLQISWVFPGNS